MKIRGEINAVSQGADGSHALLAAFLEATGKIDRRALQKRGALGDAPEVVNLEAFPALVEADLTLLLEASPTLPETDFVSVEAAQPLLEVSPPMLLEAGPTPAAPKSRIVPFAFRRANLVKA